MQQPPQPTFMVVDPVCGMELRTDEAAGKSVFEGNTYYFCTTACKDIFESSRSEEKGMGITADHERLKK